jgi:hypothetical protein
MANHATSLSNEMANLQMHYWALHCILHLSTSICIYSIYLLEIETGENGSAVSLHCIRVAGTKRGRFNDCGELVASRGSSTPIQCVRCGCAAPKQQATWRSLFRHYYSHQSYNWPLLLSYILYLQTLAIGTIVLGRTLETFVFGLDSFMGRILWKLKQDLLGGPNIEWVNYTISYTDEQQIARWIH